MPVTTLVTSRVAQWDGNEISRGISSVDSSLGTESFPSLMMLILQFLSDIGSPAPAGAIVAITPTDAMLIKNKPATIPRTPRVALIASPFAQATEKDPAR